MLVDLDVLSLVIGCCAGVIATCAVVITVIAFQHKNVTELRKEVLEINKIRYDHAAKMAEINRMITRLKLDDLVKLVEDREEKPRCDALQEAIMIDTAGDTLASVQGKDKSTHK